MSDCSNDEITCIRNNRESNRNEYGDEMRRRKIRIIDSECESTLLEL